MTYVYAYGYYTYTMTTKLTLSLEKDVINQAKKFAREKNKSLSRIIEEYLMELTAKKNVKLEKNSLPPISRELAGSVKAGGAADIRKELADYLDRKYK